MNANAATLSSGNVFGGLIFNRHDSTPKIKTNAVEKKESYVPRLVAKYDSHNGEIVWVDVNKKPATGTKAASERRISQMRARYADYVGTGTAIRKRFSALIFGIPKGDMAAELDPGVLGPLAVIDDEGKVQGLFISKDISSDELTTQFNQAVNQMDAAQMMTMTMMIYKGLFVTDDEDDPNYFPTEDIQVQLKSGEGAQKESTFAQVKGFGEKITTRTAKKIASGQLVNAVEGGTLMVARKEATKAVVGGAAKTVGAKLAGSGLATVVGGPLGFALAMGANWAVGKLQRLWNKYGKNILATAGIGLGVLYGWLLNMGAAALGGAIIGGVAGLVGGILTGASLGAVLGPVGAIAGGVLGGITGAFVGGGIGAGIGMWLSNLGSGVWSSVASSVSSGILSMTGGGNLLAVSGVSVTTITMSAIGFGAVAMIIWTVFSLPLLSNSDLGHDTNDAILFEVAKSASPGSFDTPLKKGDTITYTVNVKNPDGKNVEDVNIKDEGAKVYGKGGEKSATLTITKSGDRTFKLTNDGVELNDVNIINTVSVTAKVGGKEQVTKAVATVRVGNPPASPQPYGFPLAGAITSIDANPINVCLDRDPVTNECNTLEKRNHYGYILGRRIPGGLDIAGSGTVISTMDGVVTYAKWEPWGGVVVVESETREFLTAYLHLTPDLLVKEGDVIKVGKPLGVEYGSAITGYTSGPHVHYQVLRNGQNLTFTDNYSFRDNECVTKSDTGMVLKVNIISNSDHANLLNKKSNGYTGPCVP